MKEKFQKIKDENKILMMLAFFSISIGLWRNFRQLWLQDNQMNVSQISEILSLASFFCAIAILLVASKMKINYLKKFMMICFTIKSLNLIALFMLNHTFNQEIIQILVIIDIIIEKLITISIYPFIVTVKKSDSLYSKRKLVEYLFCDVGILVGGIFIGKIILGLLINYNVCLIISVFFLVLATIILININSKKQEEEKSKKMKSVIRYIGNSKILKVYLLCYFIGSISMGTGLGLKMLMLTNLLGFSDNIATTYLLVVGLIADVIGILCLKFWQPESDYITLTIKFFFRFLGYTLVFFTNSYVMAIVAISWSILISTAYENVTDAPYINRVPNKYQLIFTDFRYIVGAIADSIGLFFAGIMYPYGIGAILGLSAFFMIFQIALLYYGVYLRKREETKQGFRFNVPTYSFEIVLQSTENPLRKI